MPSNPKRILIAYATAGEGHRRAAEALYNYIQENYKGIEIKIVDALEYTNPIFKYLYSKGYAFLVAKLPLIWGLAYQTTCSPALRCLNKNLRYIINRLNTRNFKGFLLKYNPDIVISTHFLVTEVLSFLRRKGIARICLVTVITDFGVHPFWISKEVDEYIAASEYTKDELVAEGVAENKIRISGIPVNPRFSKRYDRNFLSKKIGIFENRFTVMLVTAGFGLGRMVEIVDLLYQDVQMLVVCGNNNKLYKRLEARGYESVKIFGFINNIEELMAVSDVIITKPGGLTISESLSMGLPMIFISAIAGQETKNLEIMERYGVGVNITNIKSIRGKIIDYKSNPEQLISIREKIARVKRPYAAKEISDALCQGGIRVAC